MKPCRNETVVRFVPWIRKNAKIIYDRLDSGICEYEDVVQEGCVAAIKSCDDEKFFPFSFMNVKSKMIDFLRKPIRKKGKIVELPDYLCSDALDTNYIDVRKAISKLEDREKAVIIMYYYERMTLEEIGNEINLSANIVNKIRNTSLYKLLKLIGGKNEILREMRHAGHKTGNKI